MHLILKVTTEGSIDEIQQKILTKICFSRELICINCTRCHKGGNVTIKYVPYSIDIKNDRQKLSAYPMLATETRSSLVEVSRSD